MTSLHSLLFKGIVYWQLPHLSLLHWLIMRLGFEIKGSKPKFSVNRINLFKALIASPTLFLQGCVTCSPDTLSSFSSYTSVITSGGCSENLETIYSTGNGQDRLATSRKCTSRNVELNGNIFGRSIFVKLFQFFIFCF